MSAFLLQLLGSVVSSVVPILLAWFQKLVPITAPACGSTHTAEELAKYRAAAHTWIMEALTELGTALVSKGLIPTWLQPELPLVEQMIASAIGSALDAAGL